MEHKISVSPGTLREVMCFVIGRLTNDCNSASCFGDIESLESLCCTDVIAQFKTSQFFNGPKQLFKKRHAWLLSGGVELYPEANQITESGDRVAVRVKIVAKCFGLVTAELELLRTGRSFKIARVNVIHVQPYSDIELSPCKLVELRITGIRTITDYKLLRAAGVKVYDQDVVEPKKFHLRPIVARSEMVCVDLLHKLLRARFVPNVVECRRQESLNVNDRQHWLSCSFEQAADTREAIVLQNEPLLAILREFLGRVWSVSIDYDRKRSKVVITLFEKQTLPEAEFIDRLLRPLEFTSLTLVGQQLIIKI